MTDHVAHTGQGLRYASFAPRLGALLLDVLLFAIPFLLFDRWGVVRYPNFHVALLAAVNLLYVPLSAWLVVRFGGSPGKLMLGLRVCDVSGGPPNYWQAALRVLPTAVAGIVGVLGVYAAASLLPQGGDVPVVYGEYLRQLTAARPSWAKGVGWAYQAFFVADCIVFYRSHQDRALHDLIARTAVVHRRVLRVPHWLTDLGQAFGGTRR
jgi:uncharacterized RDD family membrane protein YckC